jgi:excisionase family DNA binding protein
LDYVALVFPSQRRGSVDGSAAMTGWDVASYLNVDEKTVYRLVSRGGLRGFKVAAAWRFRRDDIDIWIDERKEQRAKARRRS